MQFHPHVQKAFTATYVAGNVTAMLMQLVTVSQVNAVMDNVLMAGEASTVNRVGFNKGWLKFRIEDLNFIYNNEESS